MSGEQRQMTFRGTPQGKVARALAYHQAGDLDRAERIYLRMLKADPSDGQALHLLGLLEHDRGRSDEAMRLLRRAIQYYPDQPLLYLNLGVIFESRHCFTEAIACYNRAIRLDPEEPVAWFNLGVIYGAMADPDLSAAHFRRALQLDPTIEAALSNTVYQLDLSPTATPEEQFAARRQWNDTFAVPLRAEMAPHPNAPDPERVLRIGYVSADFRQHSAWLVSSSVILGHDRGRFEVYCYSGDRREDDATAQLQRVVTWRTVHGLTDAEVARMVREDRIDILVDLSGFTAGTRLGAFARRPAPVQVTGWGYATGTGLDAMDGFLTDPIATPPEWADRHTERLVYLPCVVSYNHASDLPDVQSLPALDYDGLVTFGSFNQPKKLSTPALRLWARVLDAVPKSRLVLRHDGLDGTYLGERVRQHFDEAGIAPGRVHLFGGSSHREHVSAFRDLDIQLDPTPASGGVTTLEGNFMGVPCLTLAGDRTAGRISASIMSTLGLHDWVAQTEDEYVSKAVAFAADLDGLARLRAGLRERLRTSVICDGPRYTAAVEAQYRSLWRAWCAGQAVGSESRLAVPA